MRPLGDFNILRVNIPMYARKSRPARRPRRRATKRKSARRKTAPTYTVNTGSIRENDLKSFPDGNTILYRSLGLDDAQFDRAQAMARAFQEFRIKYVKLTFRPSADTFAPAAGNAIPQLYFQIDKANAIETDCNLQTFLDMGCRPTRFDDKNIVKIWKPSVLTTDMTSAGVVRASQVKITPWLSTNDNAGNPGATWAPNSTDHLGAAWHVTQMNPATPEVN